jgi:hypothetical protein
VPDIVFVPTPIGPDWPVLGPGHSLPSRWRGTVEIGNEPGFARLTRLEQKRNIIPAAKHREFVMSEPASSHDTNRYEQACDQAIAMCDGNLRSTIKALIMANEYLEIELRELQTASTGPAPARRARGGAA